MLSIPYHLEIDPTFAPMLRLTDGLFLTPRELARHWRLSIGHLSFMRRRGQGPRYVKINGRVVYRHADVLAYELHNAVGPVTPDSLALAIASVPALPPALRDLITTHVTAALFPPRERKERAPRPKGE